jgi:hypothetical protein
LNVPLKAATGADARYRGRFEEENKRIIQSSKLLAKIGQYFACVTLFVTEATEPGEPAPAPRPLSVLLKRSSARTLVEFVRKKGACFLAGRRDEPERSIASRLKGGISERH